MSAKAVTPQETGSVRRPAPKPQHDAVSRALAIIADLPPHVRDRFVYDGEDHDDESFGDIIGSVVFDTQNSLKVPPDVIMEAIARWAAELPEPEAAPTDPERDKCIKTIVGELPNLTTEDLKEIVKTFRPETTTTAGPAEPQPVVAKEADKESGDPEAAATAEDDDEDEDGRDDPRDENTWLQVCDKLDALLNEGGWDCLDDTFQFVRDWLKRTATFAKEDPDTLRVLNVVKKLPAKNRAELAKAMESGTLAYLIGPEKGSQTQADAIESGERAIRELYGISYKIDGAYFSLRSIEDSKDPEEREVGMNAATEIIEAMGITVRDELVTCERSLGDLSRIISAHERKEE